MGHTGIVGSTMVLLGDAGLGRDHCSIGYNVPLDDGFLCRRASPGGWCWWVDWCVLLIDLCWRPGGSFGYGLWLVLGAFFCLKPHQYTFF